MTNYPKSLKALEARFRRRACEDNTTRNCRLRGELHIYEEDLRLNRHRSPNSWAIACSACAHVLNEFSFLPDIEMYQQIMQFSPRRVILLMAACAKKAKEGAAAYRKRGINPQAAVTIDPHLKRAREALGRWRAREAGGGPQPR